MIQTFHYNISVILDDDGNRYLNVYSAFTGHRLGTCHYNKIVESYSSPEEIDDWVNSNMKYD